MLINKYRIIEESGYYFIQERNFLWFWKPLDMMNWHREIDSAITDIQERTKYRQCSVEIIF
jgi:hypothetical protein